MSPPRIWSRFSKIVNGNEIKFRIQEVGPEQYEAIFKLFLDYYMPEEAVHKAAGKCLIFFYAISSAAFECNVVVFFWGDFN